MINFKPKGTCSTGIRFEIEDGVITQCAFDDGCDGNLQALSRLVLNRKVEEVIALLEGIQCQNGTSCPDQLAKAIKAHLKNEAD